MINQNVLHFEQDTYQTGIIIQNQNQYQIKLQNGQVCISQNIIDNTLTNTNIHQIINQIQNNQSVNINNEILLCLKNQSIKIQLKQYESYCFKIFHTNQQLIEQIIDQQNFKRSKLLSSLIILNQLFKFNSNENSTITIFNNCIKYKYFNISNRIFAKNFKFPIFNLFYNQNSQNDFILQKYQFQFDILSNNQEQQYDLQTLFNNLQRQDIYSIFKKFMISILLLTQIKSDIIQQQSEIINIIEEQLEINKQLLFNELTVKKRKMGNKFIEQPLSIQEIETTKELILTYLYFLIKQIIFNFEYQDQIIEQPLKFETFCTVNMESNTLEAVIQNYQFEKIQFRFYNKIKEDNDKIYKEKNITFTDISIINNKQIIEIFDKQTQGMLSLIQEHTLNNTDETKLIDKMKQLQRSYNKLLKINQQNQQIFTITHSFGSVNYTVQDFKQSNKYESLKQFSELFSTSTNSTIQKQSMVLQTQFKTNVEYFQNYENQDSQQMINTIIVYEIQNESYQQIQQQLEQYNINQYFHYYYSNYPYIFKIGDFLNQASRIFYLENQSMQEQLQLLFSKFYEIQNYNKQEDTLFLTLDQFIKIEIVNQKYSNLFQKLKLVLQKNFRSFILRKRMKKKLSQIKILIEIQKLAGIINKTTYVLKWKKIQTIVIQLQHKMKFKLFRNQLKRRVLAKAVVQSFIDDAWIIVLSKKVTKIQKRFRGNFQRTKNQDILKVLSERMNQFWRNKKSKIIQRFYRGFQCRKIYKKQRKQIILLQSIFKMLYYKKQYQSTRIKIITLQNAFKPIIKIKLQQRQQFLNYQKQLQPKFEQFLCQNDIKQINYENLITNQFDDQRSRIFQIILNIEFFFDLSDYYDDWILSYSKIWIKCFQKRKPIQLLEVSESQTFLIDITGKIYTWGLNQLKINDKVSYFTSGENDIFYLTESKCQKIDLNEQKNKNFQNQILNYEKIFTKHNHYVGVNQNQIYSSLFQQYFTMKKNIDQVSCGFNFVILLTKGVAWSFGENKFGQLGLGDQKVRNHPCQINLETSLWVDCGQSHSIIQTIKNFYGFGNNRNGQLGLYNNQYLQPCLIPLPKGEEIISFASGCKCTFMISSSYKILATGQCQNFNSKKFVIYKDYQFYQMSNFIPIKIQATWSKSVSIINCRFLFENLQEINMVKKIKSLHQLIELFSHTSANSILPPKCEFVQKFCSQIFTNLASTQNMQHHQSNLIKSPKREFSNLNQVKEQLLNLQKKPKSKWSKEDYKFFESVNNLNILNQII